MILLGFSLQKIFDPKKYHILRHQLFSKGAMTVVLNKGAGRLVERVEFERFLA